MKRYGVIDLGTNTFHLLIVEQTTTGFKELCRKRVFIKLAEKGIKTIAIAPFQRGLQTLVKYQQILTKYEVDEVKTFGTAALRTASNGSLFVEQVYQKTGIKIDLISGEKEANLIYLGVRQIIPFTTQYSLIVDIGGGSVEFIIANEDGVHWAKSFPIGVAILYGLFHKNEPITTPQITQLKTYLNQTLQTLFEALKQYEIYNLIGASGTFDVLEESLPLKKINEVHSLIDLSQFPSFYQKIINTTLDQRIEMPEIPASRADFIVVALVLIEFVLMRTNAKQLDVSAYAMKEGILFEMMQSAAHG